MPDCTNSSELECLAEELRGALKSQDLTRGRELVLAYRAEFDRVWAQTTEGERRRSQLPGKALELLQWARTMALSHRQEIDRQRKCLRGGRKYLAPQRLEPIRGMSA